MQTLHHYTAEYIVKKIQTLLRLQKLHECLQLKVRNKDLFSFLS